jgi:hypothetical protein
VTCLYTRTLVKPAGIQYHSPTYATADPDYQAFQKQLEEGPAALPSATAQLEQAESAARASAAGEPVVTSLMAFLREKYASKPFKRGSKPRRGVPVLVEVGGMMGLRGHVCKGADGLGGVL